MNTAIFFASDIAAYSSRLFPKWKLFLFLFGKRARKM